MKIKLCLGLCITGLAILLTGCRDKKIKSFHERRMIEEPEPITVTPTPTVEETQVYFRKSDTRNDDASGTLSIGVQAMIVDKEEKIKNEKCK